jgi:hypothetical protein
LLGILFLPDSALKTLSATGMWWTGFLFGGFFCWLRNFRPVATPRRVIQVAVLDRNRLGSRALEHSKLGIVALEDRDLTEVDLRVAMYSETHPVPRSKATKPIALVRNRLIQVPETALTLMAPAATRTKAVNRFPDTNPVASTTSASIHKQPAPRNNAEPTKPLSLALTLPPVLEANFSIQLPRLLL